MQPLPLLGFGYPMKSYCVLAKETSTKNNCKGHLKGRSRGEGSEQEALDIV